jgi:hypothetical protein
LNLIPAAKALAVLIPAVAAALASYSSAQSQAEAGYKTLVSAVDKLQETVAEQQKDIARLEGRLMPPPSPEPPKPAPPEPSPPEQPEQPEQPEPEPNKLFRTLPRTLGDAVQQRAF